MGWTHVTGSLLTNRSSFINPARSLLGIMGPDNYHPGGLAGASVVQLHDFLLLIGGRGFDANGDYGLVSTVYAFLNKLGYGQRDIMLLGPYSHTVNQLGQYGGKNRWCDEVNVTESSLSWIGARWGAAA